MKKIFLDVSSLRKFLEETNDLSQTKIFSTSGGFDPLHIGHLRCFQEMKKLANDTGNAVTVAIVNGDGFLVRKKGKAFMPEEERAEIIAGLESVDYVALWDDGSQYVTGALEILKPNFFCKGGDRDSKENVPEFDVCIKMNCQIMFNVGG
jgi:D-beta-D-heptose 7-phosphate kinase/D-beta-D-heptose 1-phosphate adenosyltransferase